MWYNIYNKIYLNTHSYVGIIIYKYIKNGKPLSNFSHFNGF